MKNLTDIIAPIATEMARFEAFLLAMALWPSLLIVNVPSSAEAAETPA